MACAVKGCGSEYTKGVHVSISLGNGLDIREQFILICEEHMNAIKETNVSHYSLRSA